jgi:hypothetical protein
MSYVQVIARGYAGQPLIRALIHSNEKMAYLASPSRLEAVERGESIPIGFPIEDIYSYIPECYEKIRTEWDQTGGVSRETWNMLRSYSSGTNDILSAG